MGWKSLNVSLLRAPLCVAVLIKLKAKARISKKEKTSSSLTIAPDKRKGGTEARLLNTSSNLFKLVDD